MTQDKYAALAARSNHGAFITCHVARSGEHGALHDNQWKCLTTLEYLEPYSGVGECKHCDLIGGWVVNRCLYRDDRSGKEAALRKFVRDTVHLNSEKGMAGFFGGIVSICAGDKLPGYIIR